MDDFDFNEWAGLYEKDLQEFERRRLKALNDLADKLAADNEAERERLARVISRTTLVSQSAEDPLHGAILASKIMTESLESLQNAINDKKPERQTAKVIPIGRKK